MTLPLEVRRPNPRAEKQSPWEPVRDRNGAKATDKTLAKIDEERARGGVLIRTGNCMATVLNLGSPQSSTNAVVLMAQMGCWMGPPVPNSNQTQLGPA